MKYKKGKSLIKNKKVRIILIICLFIGGIAVMSYPAISRTYYAINSYKNIKEFKNAKDKISSILKARKIRLAEAYNSSLTPHIIYDVFSDKDKRQGIKAYAKMLELKQQIGYIRIPSINVDVPIKAGTSEDILQNSIGHMEGTSLPIGGKNTHCVLTGHRGLPEAKLFSDLDKVKIGDVFYITNIEKTLAYKVDDIKVVEPTDIKQVFIVDGKDYVTLLTCTPYMINSHRLLVRGHRIPYAGDTDDVYEDKAIDSIKIKVVLVLVIVMLIPILLYFLNKRKKRGKSLLNLLKKRKK